MSTRTNMTADSLAAYDRWHKEMPVDEESDAPWHSLLKARLENVCGKRVLEIGCGRGGFAAWLGTAPAPQRPAEIFACDFSPVAVGIAREFGQSRGASGISYRVEDITNISFQNDSFDVVISCETIEHVPDPRKAVSELARIMRPGGTMYLTCPNYLNLTGLYRLYLPLTGRRYKECGQPINNFLVLPRVRRWIRREGLEVLNTSGSGHYVPFPRRSPIRLYSVDDLSFMNPWHALHTLTIARKPAGVV
jgi:SAM-dependent methyltransferase